MGLKIKPRPKFERDWERFWAVITNDSKYCLVFSIFFFSIFVFLFYIFWLGDFELHSVTTVVLPYYLLGIGFSLFVVRYIHGKAFLWSKKLFIYLFIFTWKLILILFALHFDFRCLGYIYWDWVMYIVSVYWVMSNYGITMRWNMLLSVGWM